MASVSALFLVGSTHPIDGGLDPLFVVKLYEGDRAMWQSTSIEDTDHVIEMDAEGSSPEEILKTGCYLVNLLAHSFGPDTAGLVVFHGSSITESSANAEEDLSIKLMFTTKV
jgi:hypothetical protein